MLFDAGVEQREVESVANRGRSYRFERHARNLGLAPSQRDLRPKHVRAIALVEGVRDALGERQIAAVQRDASLQRSAESEERAGRILGEEPTRVRYGVGGLDGVTVCQPDPRERELTQERVRGTYIFADGNAALEKWFGGVEITSFEREPTSGPERVGGARVAVESQGRGTRKRPICKVRGLVQ